MIKVVICGAFGRMGTTIGGIVSKEPDMQLVGGVDIKTGTFFDAPVVSSEEFSGLLTSTKPDVVIDFTIAAAAAKNVPIAALAGSAIILGTTGLTSEQRKGIDDAIAKGNVPAVISTNYSIGMNILWTLIRDAAGKLSDYDIELTEAHHRYKKDAPSGTAKTILQILQEEIGPREEIYGREGMTERSSEIGVHVIRGGDIVGDHAVMFSSNYETVTLSHRAYDRAVFAEGAVRATRWIVGKKPGIYGMKDVLNLS
ncbi:4-hydroxy-tetrahydrodipicolinate reductase [Methanospirillum sp. J.3.6.1-F.2.7.3]|jgi:4-hydroxy-tetrahydrodipicolinate reductase|uniref:4-hydroxy-tetrahydrodipicolinate reductase n=2 Tax=Methanospirillum TaxID=2202 RepID=A0A8E7B393_9EURY|nr:MULTISPECIES: 4-hydroxy-tetrahydrodipicolinate reductase [Methanospirillum]MDX8550726.1 4-hydroxy-tetrahydrodipicolinate reductase [Methanospirillum hungatei]NLW77020.1 4-hydroxy-tetrahydrodipicolinate reductase [Methanomicrobiales archaeon]QVV90281.1 4-hydroxy-tetrahydrodipicolinate reductase [Methanospirillum sp. J.3.6.1-F.2.7.3]QXO94669.1 4-hydroxy-tetrahydrodipicolinate reductase [Methanospirillum hungatei]